MRKILALILIILSIILSGCSPAIFVLPDDMEFIETVKELDTPEKIGQYMKDNFEYKAHYIYNPSPYEVWKSRKGDCNDFATFGKFVADYHGYETYTVNIYYKNIFLFCHTIAVYIEEGKYNYSSSRYYFPIQVNSINKVIEHHDDIEHRFEVRKYEVNQ